MLRRHEKHEILRRHTEWSSYLNPVEVQTEIADLLEPFACLHVVWVTHHLYLARDLEVILLLTDESLIYLGEVEAFVGTHNIGGRLSEKVNL